MIVVEQHPSGIARIKKQRPIIEGRCMRCPRCKKLHDILGYIPLGQIEEFLAETSPIYKCPNCRWLFAPAPHALKDIIQDG